MNHSNELHPILKAVVDRMIPEDGWPSASEEGVLAYLEQRAQADPASWSAWIEPGLRAIDADAQALHGCSYSELASELQDELLQHVEHNHVRDWPVASDRFFAMLTGFVMEGYYGSAGTGGDRRRKSWDMIGYRSRPDSGNGSSRTEYAETDLPLISIDQLKDKYDAVVVGAGAGGSVAAAVLAEAGMQVLVVERGSWLRYSEIGNDHMRNHRFSKYGHNTGPDLQGNPRTIAMPDGTARITAPHEGDYHNNAMTVGGGTRVYGAQAWRFHPDDFKMASRYGIPEGSALSDWPLHYEELEPYYERAEWELGVSGDSHAHLGSGRRSRPFPMPALPMTKEASVLAKGAAKLGWEAGAVPLLINSADYLGRPACIRCGECVGFACPTDSKNGGHNTMLTRAIATGNCDLLCDTAVERIDTTAGKHATGVRLVQQLGGTALRRQIRAGHVIVAAGAIESARLFLNSASDAEPDGIGNRYDQVGRNLQGHVYAGAYALFDEPVQDGLGPGVSIATRHFNHGNLSGIIGGGLLANEFTRLPILHWYRALAPDAPRWGSAGKRAMRDTYLRTSHVQGPIQEIPNPDSRVTLSGSVKDRFGMPAAQLSGSVHSESIRAAAMLAEQAEAWMWSAGASRVWRTQPGGGLSAGQHQAGTLRMGADPSTSVTDPDGRVHGYDNLWVCDGSLHVTNGGVNPVLTILALAFRTAEKLVKQS